MNDQNLTEKDFLDIIWNYFSLHSSQRIQLLNFYIVLESLFVTGIFALFQLNQDYFPLKIIGSIAIIFFSFIFWRLDVRTKNMIKIAEEAMKSIEDKYKRSFKESILIFSFESKNSHDFKGKLFFTYTKLFNLTFIFFALIGVLSIFFSLGCLKWIKIHYFSL